VFQKGWTPFPTPGKKSRKKTINLKSDPGTGGKNKKRKRVAKRGGGGGGGGVWWGLALRGLARAPIPLRSSLSCEILVMG